MTTGIIGHADLAANTDTDLTSGGLTGNMVVNVAMVNRNSTGVRLRLAIGSGASPAATDYLEYDTVVPANGIIERTGIAISTGEKIWVRSDTTAVSARASGLPVL